MHKLSLQLEKITKPIFNKKGFYQTKIIDDWHLIVGKDLSLYTLPMKLRYNQIKSKNEGILYIYVKNNNVAIELQYIKHIVIEKIAIYFGYMAVTQIYPIVNSEIFPYSEVYDKNTNEVIQIYSPCKTVYEELSFIKDEDLKKSLYTLGKLILNSNLSKKI
ncbi:MAG: DciA family protein [Alphaproteobacteria bacterium]